MVNPKKYQKYCKEGHEFTVENTYIQIQNGIKLRSCQICKKKYNKIYRAKNRKQIYRKANQYRKPFERRIRIEVLTHYGKNGKLECVCCGLTRIEFLTLGHDNNNGQEERKKFGNQFNIILYLRRNNYPEGYSTECWNCNLGKRSNNGICPHKAQ